jgi:hypothetical protein
LCTSAALVGCPVLGLIPRIPMLLSASAQNNVGRHNNMAASV